MGLRVSFALLILIKRTDTEGKLMVCSVLMLGSAHIIQVLILAHMIISKKINVHTIIGLHMLVSIYMIISVLILGSVLLYIRAESCG